MEPPALPSEPIVFRLPKPWALGMQIGGGSGLRDMRPYFLIVAADGLAPLGPLYVAAGVHWWHVPTRDGGTPREASFDAWALRARLAVPLWRLLLLGGGFVAPYRFSNLSSGVLWGGTVEARWRVQAGEHATVFVAATVDGFGHQVRLLDDGNVAFSTPWVTASLAVGGTWEFHP
jgi:hypothetical protein